MHEYLRTPLENANDAKCFASCAKPLPTFGQRGSFAPRGSDLATLIHVAAFQSGPGFVLAAGSFKDEDRRFRIPVF